MSRLLDAPGPRAALVVEVPSVEPVVAPWRETYDPSAARGMPAHVTVLWPWLPAGALDDATVADLRDVVAAVPAFEVTFTELARFPRTLWLAPSPADPFVALTSTVQQRWPECPPYDGRFDSIVPHLTVGDAVDPDALADVVAAIAPALPVTARAEAVSVMVPDSGGRWSRRSVVPLG